MTDYRCPKHDRIFEATADQRKPGALASVNPETGKPDGKLAAHPVNGHPDCPKCQEEAREAKQPAAVAGGTAGEKRKIA